MFPLIPLLLLSLLSLASAHKSDSQKAVFGTVNLIRKSALTMDDDAQATAVTLASGGSVARPEGIVQLRAKGKSLNDIATALTMADNPALRVASDTHYMGVGVQRSAQSGVYYVVINVMSWGEAHEHLH